VFPVVARIGRRIINNNNCAKLNYQLQTEAINKWWVQVPTDCVNQKCCRQPKGNCIFPQDKRMGFTGEGRWWKIACNNCTASGFVATQRKGSFPFPFQAFVILGHVQRKYLHTRWCFDSHPFSNSTDMHLWQNRNEAYWTAQNCATATAIYTT